MLLRGSFCLKVHGINRHAYIILIMAVNPNGHLSVLIIHCLCHSQCYFTIIVRTFTIEDDVLGITIFKDLYTDISAP